MREVRWTETAKKTLQETSDFILQLWNPQVKADFIEQLDYRIGQLQQNPELAHISTWYFIYPCIPFQTD
ncbi:MAG TPA: type II toxin-antitoxin system RelE/ParE family toxin [Fulvivirga sp.]|nr:type II toxin-antitoxin system RelE/ParE family toxin [Fulvivirga sp.]